MNAQNKNHLLPESLKAGSYEAFNQLYMLYADSLYGFAKSKSNAKDIVQETFLRVWFTHRQILSDTSFKSYLYTFDKYTIKRA